MTGQGIIDSRRTLPVPDSSFVKQEAEGGCGVVGLASNVTLEGKYLLQSLVQMRNRGNGKGGGIAALGLVPEQLEYHRRFWMKTTSFRSPTLTRLLGNRWKTSMSARSSASTTSRGLKRLMIIGRFRVYK